MMSRRLVSSCFAVLLSALLTEDSAAFLAPSGRSSAMIHSTTATRTSSTPAFHSDIVSSSTTTSLQMSAAAAVPTTIAGGKVAIAALAGALSGGLFAGGLHAIAGPDHLAALLPRCVGQRWWSAGRIGALWGMGHGVSATLIGILAFFCKNRISNVPKAGAFLSSASSATEIAVGLSLVVIGLMGIKEAREWSTELETVQPMSLSAAAAESGIKTAQKRAVIFNGLLHGFSWDGAPSLAPALAVATWRGNLAFLLAYAAGTTAVMAVTTTLIGEGTRRAGQFFQRPDIPQKLSLGSSVLAIAIGSIWCGLALR
mmetsp:Transcript_13816/g.20229  ORF Transcript_13816/g.20229 Transcript_13816/m.20229 type:complete len:313 (-) Transcript_13816:127-1065(-)|eukprot:CAMPEP_0194046236 /NCGR_PEP_ID=MMETSP0009_2-20130614/20066_1 /TAXON_ID=210454 /ORGANISM="Grammatophora oceanica, Strain CCMP 410" /LENGTH=312 /DNA_ID=CAMNT_0038691443 /DNA_START=105 /DNA_END=1046 /DNA_ORIENTATION=+